MLQLGFSSDFVSILQALYYKESFFVEAGDITTDKIFPRRGLKQGCGLSPILFSIYIMDLGVRLSSINCGVDLMANGVSINNLLFADDLALISSSEDDMFHLLRVLQDWCCDFKMEVSTLKSKLVSTSDLEFWELLTPDFDYVDCIEQLQFSRYLGVDIYPSLSKIVNGRCSNITSMAASYAKNVLNLSKTLADKVDHSLAMWSAMAIPALLFACEVIPITKECIKDLERWQCILGKSVLQICTKAANDIVYTDLGLKPVAAIIWEKKLSFYKRISSDSFNGSSYVKHCLRFHESLGNNSPFIKDLHHICQQLETNLSPTTDYKKLINAHSISTITTNMKSKSSLVCCSLPRKWWKKSNYVKYTESSKVISQFRSSSTLTGNMAPLSHHSFLSAPDGRVLVCAGCGSAFNKPHHWVINCPSLATQRNDLTVDGSSLHSIFASSGQLSEVEILKSFLDTSKDSMNTIMEKASCLDKLRDHYLAMLLPSSQ